MNVSTSSLEHIAEDIVSHALQREGVLVVKPKFDHNGADLLALLDVSDGAKFCRIQCKGRSVITTKSQIEIPRKYVTDAFIVILFIEDGELTEQNVYCFFGKDIREWNRNKNNDKYTLRFSKSNYKKKLSAHGFGKNTILNIIKTIINVNITGEFKTMGHGYAELTSPIFKIEAQGN